MKLTTYLFISSLLICAACSNDELTNEDSQNQNTILVTATASMPSDAITRIFFEEETSSEGTRLVAKWNPYDQFGVTNGSGTIYTFNRTDAGSSTSSAQFSAEITGSPGDWFYAVYPSSYVSSTNKSDILLDYEFSKGIDADYKTVMWSKAQLSDDNKLNFDFNYITSVLKIKIKPFSDADFSSPYMTASTSISSKQTKFHLKSSSKCLCSGAKLNLKTGELSNIQKVDEIVLYSVNFQYAEAKTSLADDVYMSVFPGTINGLTLSFDLLDGIYEAPITATNFEIKSGKFYYTKELEPNKVGFILTRSDYIDGNSSNGVMSVADMLKRIDTRDTNCGDASRKKMVVVNGLWDGDDRKSFRETDFQPSDEFKGTYSTTASILGNWLRTKAVNVEIVDMGGCDLTGIPERMFYGCSKTDPVNIGNSALTQLILPDGITTIGEKAFADSGITQLKLMHNNTSTLTSVATTAFNDVSAIKLYLPRISSAEDAQSIRDKFTVVDKKPTVYYNNTGSATEDFTDSNYTQLP